MSKPIVLISVALIGIVAATATILFSQYDPYADVKKAVAEQLIDPQSAQFRNIVQDTQKAYCGEVNSKNRMGGYGGFTKFGAIRQQNGTWSIQFGEKPCVSDLEHELFGNN